jgi:Trypsin-like peptidase domain
MWEHAGYNARDDFPGTIMLIPKVCTVSPRIISALAVFATACLLPCAAAAQSAANAVPQPQPPQFRVMRSVTGSKGEPHDNDLTITDPRSVFHIPEDKQVIVFFEWEGPKGLHHFQGTWRGPDGKAFSVSDFQYVAQETIFRGYWTLTLPETVPAGLWALEATIDGYPAGTQAFQIVAEKSNLPPPPPAASDVYQRAVAASVFVDSLDSDGQVFSRGSGFFGAPGQVVTAFQNIDGATSVRVQFPDGSRVNVNLVLAYNRWEDWAVLKVEAPNVAPLEFAKAGAFKVGDISYVFDVPKQDSRTVQNVQLTGVQNSPKSGQRISLSWYGSLRSVGSPVLDNYGRVIGEVSGGFIPGEANASRGKNIVPDGVAEASSMDPLVVTPLSRVPDAGTPATFSELNALGVFIPPMAHTRYILSGSLCKSYKVMGPEIIADEPAREFSRKQGTVAVAVSWIASGKVKTTEELKFYDVNNHEVAQAKPRKLNLDPQNISSTGWKANIASLPNGIYRVDVVADGKVQWRGFFTVID